MGLHHSRHLLSLRPESNRVIQITNLAHRLQCLRGLFLLQIYKTICYLQTISKIFWLRGRESNSGDTAYETGREPSSPQYGVIDEIRTRSILAPQASVLPYEHQSQSQVLDSNQCEWFCRPLPRLSDNLTY